MFDRVLNSFLARVTVLHAWSDCNHVISNLSTGRAPFSTLSHGRCTLDSKTQLDLLTEGNLFFLFQFIHCLGPRKVSQLSDVDFFMFVQYFDFDSECDVFKNILYITTNLEVLKFFAKTSKNNTTTYVKNTFH